jgi:hypothetical protein
LQPSIALSIYNQCQDISLTSPVCYIHGGRWHVAPNQEIDINTIMMNRLESDSREGILEGVLIYRIQRKNTVFADSFHNESKQIRLLIAWRIENIKELHVCALLIEHDSELDEDKLRKLHQKYWHSLKARADLIESNWMLRDATVLTTTIKAMNGGYGWDIFIAKGIKNNVERPLRIDVKR